MQESWKEIEKTWLKRTSLSDEMFKWAAEAINENKEDIDFLANNYLIDPNSSDKDNSLEKRLKGIKRKIKDKISNLESELDDISLNSPNSYKLQISVPSNLNYLMKAWAASEGRDLSSVALQCLETGLREIKSKGAIPQSAIKRYDISCERRIALAEANKALESYEKSHTKETSNK